MLATLIPEPFDDERWTFEPKWDGVRTFAVCNGSTTLVSRNQRDITVAYPELADLHRLVESRDAIVDGEIVAFEGGVPSFEKLQRRIHVRDPREIERLRTLIPVAFIAFDLIYIGGRDLTAVPYTERRDRLKSALTAASTLQISPGHPTHGTQLFEAARVQGLEGIVAKRSDSRYELGARSKSWLKVKTTFEADVVVAGWSEGGGGRSGHLGSLVCAVYDGERLRYAGNVGTGFNQRSYALMEAELGARATETVPFPPETLKEKRELQQAHWVRPELVAIIEFRQLTSGGKLRAPSFKGLREDKPPSECTYEDLRRIAGLG
jgi:bifunctional non-homologous end joining protein LigD